MKIVPLRVCGNFISLLGLCFYFAIGAKAADSLIHVKAIPISARSLASDELGNVYVVKNDNSLIRYSQNGDSTAFYKSISNGDITTVDASNPLRVLLYYAPFSKVVVLDRMLA